MSVPVINEITRTEKWLHTVLAANPSIAGIVANRIYSYVIPQEITTYPCLVFQWIGTLDDLETGGPNRVWSRSRYLVKGIYPPSGRTTTALPLQTLMDLVDQELHGARGGVTGAAIDYCRRIRPFRMVTVENNQLFHHIGAEWEIALRAQA